MHIDIHIHIDILEAGGFAESTRYCSLKVNRFDLGARNETFYAYRGPVMMTH